MSTRAMLTVLFVILCLSFCTGVVYAVLEAQPMVLLPTMFVGVAIAVVIDVSGDQK